MIGFLFYLNREQFALRLVAVPVFYILLVWMGLQLYLFPLLIEQEVKQLRSIFRNALVLMARNVIFTIVLGLLLLAVVSVAAILAGPILLILISFLAVAQTLALQQLLAAQYEKNSTN